MATLIEVRGAEGTKYRVQVRLRGVLPQSATFERKTDAKRWAAQTEAAIREGRHFRSAAGRRKTVGDLVDRYLRDVNPLKPRSMKDRGRHLLWWKAQIGHVRLTDATPPLLAEYRDRLLHGATNRKTGQRSPGTANRYLGALSHAFTMATREWEWLDANPCRRVRRAQEPRGRVRFLSEKERDALLKACRANSNRHLYPLVVLAISTGARFGELIGLRWRDVDLARHVIRLEKTKNDDRRALPLAGPALEAVKELARLRRLGSDLLFPSEKGDRPASVRKAWQVAVDQARLEDFRFHDLRHTAASYLAMSGATLAEIAEVLGHRTLAMVRRYAHLAPEHVAGVVARMNAKFLGA